MKKQYQETTYGEHFEAQGEMYALDVKIVKVKKDDIYIDSVKDNETEIRISFNGMTKSDLTTWIKFLIDIKARMK